jgi:uncharacterized protein with HEPN domain
LSSEKPSRRLKDIIANAQAISEYTSGMDFAAFTADQRTYDAVERCLQRISEAASKLGDFAPVLVPEQPWKRIRALGNYLSHAYDVIEAEQLWDVIRVELPSLRAACEDALKRLP